MAEPLADLSPPTNPAPDALADAALARKNMVWGWALFGVFGVLFGGTFGVALVYLWLS